MDVDKFDIHCCDRVDKNQIIDIIEHDLDGQIVSCLKKKNYFFINKDKIIKDILKDSRLKTVSITKEFSDKMIVDVVEYKNVAIWCASETKESCFIIDNGIAQKQITMEDSVVTNNKHFIIIDNAHKDVAVGDHVITEENLQKIETLSNELKFVLDAEIEQSFKITSQGSGEVQFTTDEGWYIIIDLSQDLNKILDIAKLFVKKVDLPGRRSDLEYVDMRFREKIFYKMKDGVEQIEENEEIQKTDKKNTKDKDDIKNKKEE